LVGEKGRIESPNRKNVLIDIRMGNKNSPDMEGQDACRDLSDNNGEGNRFNQQTKLTFYGPVQRK